jgi:hypothetical protein
LLPARFERKPPPPVRPKACGIRIRVRAQFFACTFR